MASSRQEHLSKLEGMATRTQDFAKWRAHSALIRDRLKLPASGDGHRPWTSRAGVHLRGLPDSHRQRDVLDVCFAAAARRRPDLTVSQLVRDLWCNPGQGVQRLPYSERPPTFSSSCIMYHFGRDVALSGEAHMRLIGWNLGVAPLEVMTDGDSRSLSADAFSVPIAALMTWAIYQIPSAPWWSGAEV